MTRTGDGSDGSNDDLGCRQRPVQLGASPGAGIMLIWSRAIICRLGCERIRNHHALYGGRADSVLCFAGSVGLVTVAG